MKEILGNHTQAPGEFFLDGVQTFGHDLHALRFPQWSYPCYDAAVQAGNDVAVCEMRRKWAWIVALHQAVRRNEMGGKGSRDSAGNLVTTKRATAGV